MNKKFGLLLTLLFVGTVAFTAKKDPNAFKKENAPRERILSVKNTLNEQAKLTIIDTQNQKHTIGIAPKEFKVVAKTTDKTLKMKNITAKVGDKTATKEFKRATRKAHLVKSKKGEIKIKKGHQNRRKCDICKSKNCKCRTGDKKCAKCKRKHCKCPK